MIIALPGVPMFWAEGKVIKDNLFAPTPIQFQEGMKWIEAGVSVVLIGWHHGMIDLSPWKARPIGVSASARSASITSRP